jgi:uncharacterized protein (DUF488 family)
MKIFTIGFTQKTAEQFFGLLRVNRIERIVDIRLRPEGQLAGFAKKDDLAYFLRELANGCQYIHMPELAPTSEILDEYRKDKNWTRYLLQFHALMDERNIPDALNRKDFETSSALLCSEAIPEHCHRRLVAERMAAAWPSVEIVHL